MFNKYNKKVSGHNKIWGNTKIGVALTLNALTRGFTELVQNMDKINLQ